MTYEEVGVVGDVVAEHDETVLAVVDAKLHLRIDSKVLLYIAEKVNITVAKYYSLLREQIGWGLMSTFSSVVSEQCCTNTIKAAKSDHC